MKFKALILLILIPTLLSGQDDYHNREVEPQNIDCDKFSEEYSDIRQAIKSFTGTTFSFTQQFKTGKTSGVMAGKFYSCNNDLGYLALKIDGKYEIYKEIPFEIWNDFSESNDLDSFYHENIRGRYTVIAKEE